MTFRVETTAQAENDADAILEWLLSQHAGETGARWFQALENAIASLEEFPKRCGLAPENRAFPFEVRQLLYGQKPHVYRILFTIRGDAAYVLHIRHGSGSQRSREGSVLGWGIREGYFWLQQRQEPKLNHG